VRAARVARGPISGPIRTQCGTSCAGARPRAERSRGAERERLRDRERGGRQEAPGLVGSLKANGALVTAAAHIAPNRGEEAQGRQRALDPAGNAEHEGGHGGRGPPSEP
jgi:hypothetical protein